MHVLTCSCAAVWKRLFLAVAICAGLIPSGSRTGSAAEPPRRCLWVIRDAITTPADVETVVDCAVRYGYDALFVQVRGRGDAYYKSYFVPGPDNFPDIPDAFDPLGAVIASAHARGIKVHAWFNMNYTWSDDHPPRSEDHAVNAHPEWFMVSVNGLKMGYCPIDSVRTKYVEGRYLSPALEEVRSHLARIITEVLVSYDIDGVHLDYIRYPGRGYDFSDRMRLLFYERYGVDPVMDVMKGKEDEAVLYFLERWIDFRAEQIDKLVRSVARRIAFVNRDVSFSAAVKPDVDEAYVEYGQNWAAWLNEGVMDFVVTMSYFRETDVARDILLKSIGRVDKKKVIGGIGAYILSPEKTAEQIRLMSDLGLAGYSIFSYATFRDNPGFADTVDTLVRRNRTSE